MAPTFDFVIAGAARSGTTSLHRHLARHPSIFLPTAKELAFFANPAGDARQAELVASFYRTARPEQRVGLTDANLLLVAEAGARLAEHNPAMRVLAILRNPVDRAYSAYWFCRLRGWESASSFEDGLARERQGLTTRYDQVNFGYLEHGRYATHLGPIVAALGRDRVHLLLTEDLATDPESALAAVFAHLDVDPDRAEIDPGRKHNRSKAVRYPRLGAWLEAGLGPVRWLLRHSVPVRGRHWLRHHVVRRARAFNRKSVDVPPMNPETRARLIAHFRPLNNDLEALIGRDLIHWSA